MENRYIFVTGAAGGFGQATVRLLLAKGFRVFAADINPLPDALIKSGKVIPVALDITDKKSVEKAAGQVRGVTGQLAGLVNIAAVFDQFPLAEADPAAFDNLIRTNLFGAQYLTAALFPLLYKGMGRIVNLSSQSAVVPMPLMSYGFSKKIFDDWNTQLRMELAILGMKVIVIRAGGHKTPFLERSKEVLMKIDESSAFAGLMRYARDKGIAVLNDVKNTPESMARTIVKALTDPKPKKVYNVNVDLMFRLLSWLPAGLREKMLVSHLKKQNKKKAP